MTTLHMHPASPSSRPVMLLCDEAGLDVALNTIDLMEGEQFGDAYRAINPNCKVPCLVDGDFTLTESSAIMKYLADKAGSDFYPSELRARARVNERMDWFNTNLYREWGYHFVYPQVFDHQKLAGECNDAFIEWGIEKAAFLMGVLDGQYLAGSEYVAGDQVTLADFFGASIITLAEWIGQDASAWPNVDRWIATMKARPSWARVNETHDGFAAMMSGGDFRRMDGA